MFKNDERNNWNKNPLIAKGEQSHITYYIWFFLNNKYEIITLQIVSI
jgi:hypothetical protein